PVAARVSSRRANSPSSARRTLRYENQDNPAVAASATTAKRSVAKTVRCSRASTRQAGGFIRADPRRPGRGSPRRLDGDRVADREAALLDDPHESPAPSFELR